MAVTIVNSDIAAAALNQISQTRSFTVSAGADLLIVSPVASDNLTFTYSTVTFNGDNLSLLTNTAYSSTMRLAHYYLAPPDITTGNIIVTCSAAVDVLWSGASSWTGADQTTPVSDGVGGTTSVTVANVGADDVAIASCADNYISSASFASSWTPTRTQIWEIRTTGTGQCCTLQYEATLTGSVSLGMSAGTPVAALGLRIRAASAALSAEVTGTITGSISEADIVSGVKELLVEVVNTTLVASGGAFDGARADIIAGLDSNLSEAGGWNAKVRDIALSVTDVTRGNDTIYVVAMPVVADYDITTTETITVTVPASAVVAATPITAAPTFTVSPDSSGGTHSAINSGPINRGPVSSGLVGS